MTFKYRYLPLLKIISSSKMPIALTIDCAISLENLFLFLKQITTHLMSVLESKRRYTCMYDYAEASFSVKFMLHSALIYSRLFV